MYKETIKFVPKKFYVAKVNPVDFSTYNQKLDTSILHDVIVISW